VHPRVVHPWPVMAAGALLLVLVVTAGLGAAGVLVGLAAAAGGSWWLGRSAAAHGVTRLGPADVVTVGRAVLVVAVTALVTALVTDPVMGPVTGGAQPRALLVGLAAVALSLDLVDGQVARRTGSVSAFGASLDMEVDAWLILVLAVAGGPEVGWWVLSIGLARYALGLAALLLPVLRRPVPVRRWAKVVAAVQGITLLVVLTGLLPVAAAQGLLGAALLLLAESFTHQVRWLVAHPVTSYARAVEVVSR
jgi:phosphatidylglycerophosphate synthase